MVLTCFQVSGCTHVQVLLSKDIQFILVVRSAGIYGCLAYICQLLGTGRTRPVYRGAEYDPVALDGCAVYRETTTTVDAKTVVQANTCVFDQTRKVIGLPGFFVHLAGVITGLPRGMIGAGRRIMPAVCSHGEDHAGNNNYQ